MNEKNTQATTCVHICWMYFSLLAIVSGSRDIYL